MRVIRLVHQCLVQVWLTPALPPTPDSFPPTQRVAPPPPPLPQVCTLLILCLFYKMMILYFIGPNIRRQRFCDSVGEGHVTGGKWWQAQLTVGTVHRHIFTYTG